MRLPIIFLLLISLALVACEDQRDQPTQLDAPYLAATDTPEPTPWPTVWPTATAVPQRTVTPRPSATTFVRPAPDEATPEPLDDYVVPGDWLYRTFEDDSGALRRLDEFLGRGVVLHTLSATCDMCVEQQRIILSVIQERYNAGLLPDTVFLALGVVPPQPPSMIRTVLQNELSEEWAIVETLDEDPAVNAEWIVGTAGSGLLDTLEQDFGPEAIDPAALTVIVIEPNGVAHLMKEGLVDFDALQEAIGFYGNPIEP